MTKYTGKGVYGAVAMGKISVFKKQDTAIKRIHTEDSEGEKKRVAKAVANLKLPFMSRSLKPLSFGITRARKKLGLAKNEVVMVGDQLMTDMLAAHQAGVRSILVKPIVQTDKWTTRMNRLIEKYVWRELRRHYPNLKWQEDLND